MKPRLPYDAKQHILITGGLGFLGSTLAQALVKLNATVTLYDAMLPMYGANLFNIHDIRSDVTVIKKDIRDAAAIKKAVKNQDIIFNIAAQTSHVDSMKNPMLDLDINCRGQLTLLEACRAVNPHVKIVYAGSRAQYGAVKKLPVTEETPMVPIDIYGTNKIAGEHYHFIYQRMCGLRAVSLRLTNIYGPRHQMRHARYGVQNYMIRLAMDGKTIPVYGKGTQQRDFLYIDDAIDAFLCAGATENTDGKAFVVGSGQPIRYVDFMQETVKVAGSGRLSFVPWATERARIETGDFVTDPEKFTETTGWKPKTSLRAGLEKTIAFYSKYRSHYW